MTDSAPVSARRKRGIKLTVVVLAVFIAVLLAGFVYVMSGPRTLSQEELQANGAFVFDRPRELSSFSLVDHNGDAFTPADMQGHWSLLFFGFTSCPDVCPSTMAELDAFYEELAPRLAADTRIYMVSVDPARDTPERLKEYVSYFNPRFTGVTGEFLKLHKFATELNIPFSKVPGGGDNYLVEHSAAIALVNPRGHHVGFLRPPHDVAKLLLTYRSIHSSRS